MKSIPSTSVLRVRMLCIASLLLVSPLCRAAGTVVAWGDNSSGQLNVPAGLTNVVAISAGERHCLALRADGTMVAWGDNSYGQGVVPAGLSDVVAIDAGHYFNLALKSDGTVFAWGQNHAGQSSVPAGLVNVKAIAAGATHGMALKSDGRVVVWGHNGFGEITGAADLTEIVAIAAGSQHCLALKSDGSVVAWGIDTFGQSFVPEGLTDVISIAAGATHSLALKRDGTAVVWGGNAPETSTVPPNLTNVVALGGGYDHCLALTSDGRVVAWGDNRSGQSIVPDGLTNIVAIAAGGFHSLALADGTPFIPVTITADPAQQVVPLRGTATFSATASSHPAPSYQWLFKGQLLAGATASTLVLTNVGTNMLGNYSMVAWNAYSAATSSPAMLLMSPSIRSPFLGATVIWGKSATLTASAVGSGELSYQWFKDGVAIPFASGPTLVIPTVQLTDGGLYSLVVRSIWGSVTNAAAQVVVNPANTSIAMYAGVTIDGVAGYTYGIQYTTDLRDTNSWVNATNLTLEVPLQTWIDFQSATNARRFYRVIAR